MTQRISQSQNLTKTRIVIIGAGFGGLSMAIRLQQSQFNDFIILEKANAVGGTWRENQYPGAACDVQSHLYSLSFAAKPDWSKRYAEASEIFDYIQDLVERYQLKQYIQFNKEVCSAHYDEQRFRWSLLLKNGECIESQYVIFASGPLHVPQIPKIKGIEKFKGQVFHSSQWKHDYNLDDKSIASIGTGGSAIQYIPEIAKQAQQLYVFQRTAAWVIPRDERSYSRLEQYLFKHLDWFRKFHRARLYWSNEARVVPIVQPKLMKYGQKLAEMFIRYQVKDQNIAKKLTPDYVLGCKRILISNQYYPTFNRGNVELICEAIQEVTEDSIVTADGISRPMDCLIYGTGFITDPRIYLKSFECFGLGGLELKQAWKAGSESFYGIMTKQFPNLFQLLGPNTLLGHNSVIFMIEAQVDYILQLIEMVDKNAAQAVVVRDEIQNQFNQRLQKQFQHTVWQSGCVSWYQQQDGKNFALWPSYTWKYWRATQHLNPKNYHLLGLLTAQNNAA